MSVHENAVVLRFADRAIAYQALSDLKHLTSDTTEVRGAVLIERLDDGTVRAPERIGAQAGNNKMMGSMAGSMAGMSAGPVGMLVATGLGTVLAGGYDSRRAAADTSEVEFLSERVGRNGTAIFVDVKESDTETLDVLAMEYDAVLERCSARWARAELKAMVDATEQTRKADTREKREVKRAEVADKVDRRRAEVAEKVDARVATLKRKLVA